MKKENIVLLGHGSGGKMSHDLIKDIFLRHFDNPVLSAQTDSAVFDVPEGYQAFTTDSYVVDPIFFPGGNIGKLAVCGTVNDLAVAGAIPRILSASFILEEGFSLDELNKIAGEMANTAEEAGVRIVTGDTKVVQHGKCDKVFINTSGVGWLPENRRKISYGTGIREGDKVILSGYLGDHGIAVMAARESLELSPNLVSDCAPLNGMIEGVLAKYTSEIRFMRDPTRGGVGTVLSELASVHNLGIDLDESKIPVSKEVRGACEIFGYDPLYLANEGKVIIIAGPGIAGGVLELLKQHPYGRHAAIVGEITRNHPGKVVLTTEIGGRRIVDMLAGEQLPRIC